MSAEDHQYWLEHDFLSELLKQLPSHVFWKDAECVYLGCNDVFARGVGLSSPQDIIGKSDFDLPITKEESVAYQEDDREVMRSRKAKLNIEETQTFADGRKIVLLTSKVPLLNKDDKVIGVLGIYTDITERKKLEEDLRQSKEKAEAASHAKTEFIQNMSHDICTPLTGVIGSAILLEKSAHTKDQENTAHMIHVSGQRLLDLLNEVLGVVSVENINDTDLHKETFDLPQRIQILRDLILPIMETKKIRLVFDIDPKTPRYVIADRIKLERILLNLVGNAIKFTEKGQVELHVKVLPCDKDHARLEFTVSDTGIGIPKEKLHQIFDRFFRVNPSFKGIHQGHGIGLYIVRKYVTLLGGEVHVDSEEGKGTLFRFSLLMKIGKAEDVIDADSVEVDGRALLNLNEKKSPQLLTKTQIFPAVKGAINVLFIEDDVIASTVGAHMLSGVGCVVHAVPDAETALKLFKTQHFDLVISDLGLPGMSGSELAALMRLWEKINAKPPTPIVALTGHAGGPASDECILAGMNKVFAKPLLEEKALSILKEFCRSP